MRGQMIIDWRVYFGLLLIALSASLYLVHFGIFQDLAHIEIYALGDVAFLPIEVPSSSSSTGSYAGKNSGVNSANSTW